MLGDASTHYWTSPGCADGAQGLRSESGWCSAESGLRDSPRPPAVMLLSWSCCCWAERLAFLFVCSRQLSGCLFAAAGGGLEANETKTEAALDLVGLVSNADHFTLIRWLCRSSGVSWLQKEDELGRVGCECRDRFLWWFSYTSFLSTHCANTNANFQVITQPNTRSTAKAAHPKHSQHATARMRRKQQRISSL